jgi:hypothetical protein
MTDRRKTPGDLLLDSLPVVAGAVAGFGGAAALADSGVWRIVLTVVLSGVTALVVGFAVDHAAGRRHGGGRQDRHDE